MAVSTSEHAFEHGHFLYTNDSRKRRRPVACVQFRSTWKWSNALYFFVKSHTACQTACGSSVPFPPNGLVESVLKLGDARDATCVTWASKMQCLISFWYFWRWVKLVSKWPANFIATASVYSTLKIMGGIKIVYALTVSWLTPYNALWFVDLIDGFTHQIINNFQRYSIFMHSLILRVLPHINWSDETFCYGVVTLQCSVTAVLCLNLWKCWNVLSVFIIYLYILSAFEIVWYVGPYYALNLSIFFRKEFQLLKAVCFGQKVW